MQFQSPLTAALVMAGACFALPASAQNQAGSLLGLAQVLTGPGTTVNVANDNGGPALARVGALPVGDTPSLLVSAVRVAPVDLLPLPGTSTQVPIIPGVLSLTAGPGLGINVLADRGGPSVADVNLLPVGSGSDAALSVRAIRTADLQQVRGLPGVLDLSSQPSLMAGALNAGAGSSLATVQALPVNGAPGAVVSAIGFTPVNAPLAGSGLPPVTAQILPGVLEAQLQPGLDLRVLNDGGGPAVVDAGVIPFVQGGSALRISALSSPVNAVPEPNSWALFGLGLGMMGWVGVVRARGARVATTRRLPA